jgi:hypothetical protein
VPPIAAFTSGGLRRNLSGNDYSVISIRAMRHYTAKELERLREKRGEQRRLAQRRYRQNHADRLKTARRVSHLLTRQAEHFGEIAEAAKLIRELVGGPYAKALGQELTRRAQEIKRSPRQECRAAASAPGKF